MASPNVKYDDILTTTLEHRNKKLADNVTNNNALLRKLKERGKIRTIDGGSKIVEELEYGEGDMMWYSGYDEINYTPKQLFTAAEYNMKLCAVPVAISGEDMLKNSGRERIMNLFEKRIENAEKTMMNQMAKAIYGDGTENSGKSISGLKLLVADAPATGTVGGIDRASNAWWRNQSKTAAATFTSETLRPAMNAMWLTPGSEAYQRAMSDLQEEQNAATNQAAYQAVLQGQNAFTDSLNNSINAANFGNNSQQAYINLINSLLGNSVSGYENQQNIFSVGSGLSNLKYQQDMANRKGGLMGALSGAINGAAAGSALGPWGIAAGAGLGGLSGYNQRGA